MQVTEVSSEGLKHELTVVIDAKEIGEKVDARLEALQGQVNLPGFRPGKVPVTLLRKRFGSSVMGEVLEEAVNATSQQALSERELRPATQPSIEITKFDEGSDLEYKMSVEVMPKIEMMDFSKLEIERLKVEVTDGDLDEALKHMAENEKAFVKVARNRKSKEGDALLIDFLGKIDGEAFEGGTGEDFQLELGSGTFIPGFEEQMVGAKGGDHVEVKVSFPADYGAAELAGKETVFEVDVKEVREAKAGEVTDDLAKKFGLENLDALKEALKGQMEQENSNLSRARQKRLMLDELDKHHSFEVPPGMVETEFEGIWSQIEEQRKSQDGTEDDKDADKSDDELKEEYRVIAERRVRLGLLLSEIGSSNNIQVQDEEVNRALMERARNFPGQEQQMLEYYQKNPEAVNQLRAPIYEDKVVDFILEMAKVEDRTVTRDELLHDPDEEDAAAAKPAKKAAAKKAPTKKAPAKPKADTKKE